MTDYISAAPAYGRDYRSKTALLADWEAGKDFEITDVFHARGRYINKEDKRKYCPLSSLMIRYTNGRKVLEVKA